MIIVLAVDIGSFLHYDCIYTYVLTTILVDLGTERFESVVILS